MSSQKIKEFSCQSNWVWKTIWKSNLILLLFIDGIDRKSRKGSMQNSCSVKAKLYNTDLFHMKFLKENPSIWDGDRDWTSEWRPSVLTTQTITLMIPEGTKMSYVRRIQIIWFNLSWIIFFTSPGSVFRISSIHMFGVSSEMLQKGGGKEGCETRILGRFFSNSRILGNNFHDSRILGQFRSKILGFLFDA